MTDTTEFVTSFAGLDDFGFPGYRMGDDGTLWSRLIRGSKNHRLRDTWLPIKHRKNPRHLYYYVTVKQFHGKRRHFKVGVLVLMAFRGKPEGMVCRHLNGNSFDDRLSNLEWGTQKQNMVDKIKHGTHREGRRISNAILSEDSVRQIRQLIGKRSYESIGREFGVSGRAIGKVANRETWKHVLDTPLISDTIRAGVIETGFATFINPENFCGSYQVS